MPLPTRRLALVALVLAGVRLVLPNWSGALGLLLVNAVLVIVAFVDWARTPDPNAIAFERTAPRAITLGERATVAWQLRNPTGRAIRVGVADELAPSLRASRRRTSLTIPSHGQSTVRIPMHPARRGRFAPTDVTIRVEGPLGLMARQRTRKVRSVIRVLPPFRSKDEAELRINRARLLEVGLRSAQGRGGGTEFESLREYSADDEFRRVDWAATARTAKPIVRTYRSERNQTVVVLLDNGRVMAGRIDDVPRVEHAMDAALMLATVATRLGDRYGLVVFDRDVRTVIAPSKTRSQVSRVTEALFDLEPELVESDYRGAFADTIIRFRRRALLVLITELNEQAAEEYLVPALPLVVRSHVVVIGAVRDPEVERWATARVTEPYEAFRRAAAVQALDERARTAARLRGLGATVVDAEPGRLSADLADTYLRLKATGRL